MTLSTIEQKLLNFLEPTANQLGFEIVKIQMHGGNRKVLEIAVDRLDDNKVTIKDCRTLSNNFSAILDIEDIIEDKYYLEISSAGVERPLVKLNDFIRFKGRIAVIKLHNAVEESKKWQGEIISIEGSNITLKIEKIGERTFAFDNIKGANLVFTEEMFREILRKDKKDQFEPEEEI